MYHDRQGVAVVPPTVPGAYLGIPEKGTMRKQKSIGRTHVELVCGGVGSPCMSFSFQLVRLSIRAQRNDSVCRSNFTANYRSIKMIRSAKRAARR